MRHLTAIALLLAIWAPLPAEEDAQTTPSPLGQAFAVLHGEADQPQQDQPVEADMDVEVVEVFSAETPEDLEAALADGYPPPWLAEILQDETIPEEDRYWLDCRVRAAIARDLHIFYDREGYPVYVECDCLHPGEDYWREHFIINPPGDSYRYDSSDMPTNIIDQPGYIVNLYGEKVGDIALTRSRVWLSRDASIGIGVSDITGHRAHLACLLYPDGSFIEREVDPIHVQIDVSESGDVAVYHAKTQHSPDSEERMLHVFNRHGDLIFERLTPTRPRSGSATPTVSPNDEYLAIPLTGGEIWLLDSETGETIYRWGGGDYDNPENWHSGSELTFSRNSRYLCASGYDAVLLDCITGDLLRHIPVVNGHMTGPPPYTDEIVMNLWTTNDAGILTGVRRIDLHDGTPYIKTSLQSEIYTNSPTPDIILDDYYPYPSPNGVFLLIDHYDSHYYLGVGTGSLSTPLSVAYLREVWR